MHVQVHRRGFLKSAASAGVGWLILGSSRSARSYQANEKLNVAVVGIGKRGSWHVSVVPRVGQNLVALCDADHQQAADVFKQHPAVPKYRDFRKMLDEMDRQIDALVIATPDHTHGVIAARAMECGKHVYVEKPIAHDVNEARTLRRIASERRVATQQGNQGMATDSFRRTVELVREGVIGEIREAHVWYVFGGSGPLKRPEGSPPLPADLDWDCFLGPAPFRPYHPNYITGWGAWREFSTGCFGGGGSHSINMAFKGLNLGVLWEGKGQGPIRIETEVSESCPENFPRWQTCRFDIPARESMPPATIHWYNASEEELQRQGIWDRLQKIAGRSLEWKDGSWTPRSGTLLVGSKGVVHTNAHNSVCDLLPKADFPNASGPPHSLPSVAGHQQEWVAACKGGPAPLANFDHSGPAIELMLLGNVASLATQPLEFDPVACKITNNEEADRVLRTEHRPGWSLSDGTDV
jgi:hypothetical protein